MRDSQKPRNKFGRVGDADNFATPVLFVLHYYLFIYVSLKIGLDETFVEWQARVFGIFYFNAWKNFFADSFFVICLALARRIIVKQLSNIENFLYIERNPFILFI